MTLLTIRQAQMRALSISMEKQVERAAARAWETAFNGAALEPRFLSMASRWGFVTEPDVVRLIVALPSVGWMPPAAARDILDDTELTPALKLTLLESIFGAARP
jgi:hypothetical protein